MIELKKAFYTAHQAGQRVVLMADQEKTETEILLDAKNANLRAWAGCTVQTIPRPWLQRADLQAFFTSDLEIALVRVEGQPHIEIRRRQWAVEKVER